MNNIPQQARKSTIDVISECHNQMANNSLPFPSGENLILDNNMHRYSADNKPEKDEWYWGISDEDGTIVVYGSWSTGDKFTFNSWSSEDTEDSDIRLRREYKIKELKQKADKERDEKQYQASLKALECFENHVKPTETHLGYPNYKGIKPLGVRFMPSRANAFMVPLRDTQGKLWSIQFIIFFANTMENDKKFFPDSRTGSVFHVINDEKLCNDITIYVCEGWATGVSIYEVVKAPNVRVVAAMSMLNISKTIDVIRKSFNCTFIICSDGSPREKEAANEAATRFGCKVTYPYCPEGNDFNDVHKTLGIEALKEQLSKTVEFESNIEAAKRLAGKLLKKEDPCAGFNLKNMPPIIRDHVLEVCCSNSASQLIVLTAILASCSSAIGKRFIMEESRTRGEGYFNRLYCNLWMLSIAPSGWFKSTAIGCGSRYVKEHRKIVREKVEYLKGQIRVSNNKDEQLAFWEMIRKTELKSIMLPDRITPEALLQMLGQGRGGGIFNSEFDSFLKSLTKPGNTELMSLFTKFYDCEEGASENNTKTQGSDYVDRPYITICGVTTPVWMSSGFNDNDIRGGFGARFLIFILPGNNKRPPSLPNGDDTAPINTYAAFKERLNELPTFRRYKFSEDALPYYDVIYNQIYDLKDSFGEESEEILTPFTRRWCPYIIKVAMIMQYFFDKNTDLISIQAINAAFDFVLPAIKSTIYFFKEELGESKFEREQKAVFKWICTRTESQGFARHDAFVSSRIGVSLGKQGRLEAITTLKESGKIEIIPGKTMEMNVYKILNKVPID